MRDEKRRDDSILCCCGCVVACNLFGIQTLVLDNVITDGEDVYQSAASTDEVSHHSAVCIGDDLIVRVTSLH